MSKLEELKGKEIPVLDDGFVKLIDIMGNDSRVCEAARLTAGDLENDSSPAKDRGLIRYLYRHHHGTPFEFVTITLHLRLPMDVMRQWTRHRTWKYLSINEYSTRYSKAIDSIQKTDPGKWRLQAKSNRQGSDGYLEKDKELTPPGYVSSDNLDGSYLTSQEELLHSDSTEFYNMCLETGIAREQARRNLPLGTYTELWVEMDLRNMLEFLCLRMDSHAQEEIREYATIVGEQIIKPLFPTVWEAFEDYRLNAMSLSAIDIRVITQLIQTSSRVEAVLDTEFSNKREKEECLEKLKTLGFIHG